MAYFQPRKRSSSVSGGASNSSSAFKVAVRVRPLLEKERKASAIQCVTVEFEHNAIVISKPEQTKRNTIAQIEINDFTGLVKTNSQNFFFDTVFGQSSAQDNIYNECARHIVLSVLEGYNGSIIAYGQTGTGKSFTIEGGNEDNDRGLIPRSSEEIFDYIHTTASTKDRFLVRVSFLEIYNEKISDLLEQNRTNLRIREDGVGGMYVENLSEHIVKSTEDMKALIRRGSQVRTTAATRSNTESSRSHAIFTIIVEHAQSTTDGGNIVTIGKLRLADLAGSERYDVDSQTKRQDETRHINVSLHVFGKVVMSLTSSSSNAHIPYRDSKLTKILQDSLGGNCKTTMITTISPVPISYTESLNSLKFAKRAKHVKNNAIINKDISQKALLSAYQQEIQKLREQLQSQGDGGESTELIQLEREKEIAEKQKDQVLSELEKQKLLYNKVEREKIEFQRQIELLEQKLLHGGSDLTNNSELKRVLEVERERIAKDTKQEYQEKLAEIEEEKKRLEREKAEMKREKEQLLQLRTQIIPSDHHSSVISKKPTLPKPILATRHSRPLPLTVPTHQHHSGFLGQTPSLVNSQLPSRRPRVAGQLQSISPTVYDQNIQESYQEALQQYYISLADPVTGIPCQELQTGIRIFTGKDAIEWFISNMEGVSSIDEAVRIGNRLIEIGMVAEIQGHDQFVDSSTVYYQFIDQNSYYTSSYNTASRPGSAFSMLSLPNSQQIMRQTRSRAASLPGVNRITSGLESSFIDLSSSPSLATLQLTSPIELMDSFELTMNNPTQLHIAAISGNVSTVHDLSKTISIDSQDSAGYTPLMYATLGRQPKCCSILLKNLRAKVNIKNMNDNTALLLAIMNDSHDVIKVLLKNHADTQHVDDNGDNVFHVAVKNGSTRCLKILLKYSTNLLINERNIDCHTPLHIAVLNHHHDCIIMLLNAKSDIGVSDSDGQTALHLAVSQNCTDCTLSIMSLSPNDVDLVDINGMNSLHIASCNGFYNIVEILLQSQKCDVNMRDNQGRTPLHLAVLGNNYAIVQVLLKTKADQFIKDNDNKTPLDYAYEKKYTNCLKLLKTSEN